MSATCAGYGISAVDVVLPLVGVWSAEVLLVDAQDLAGAVELVVDDLVLAGTVLRGGPVEGSARYLITGGAGGWRRVVPARTPYDNDAGVKLSTILAHLATDTGEKVALAAGVDRVVGQKYVPRDEEAWNVFPRLRVGSWWMDAAGVTQVGPRPAPAIAAAYRLLSWNRARGVRRIATETLSAFTPGGVLEGDTIRQVSVHAEHEATRLEVWA